MNPSPSLPFCSVIIVGFNGCKHLKRCLPSIFLQNYPEYEVLLIDNGSTDGSTDLLEHDYPKVKLIKNRENLGYARAVNTGLRAASGEYFAVLNQDTEVEPNWLMELVNALEEDQSAAMAAPKILMMDHRKRINTCGNDITFTGLTFCRGLDKPANSYSKPEIISAVSGAAFVIKRAVFEEIGGFDENFFMYYEDTDLSLRVMLAGYRCLYVPRAIVCHEYHFRFSASKCFYQERNRYYSLLKTLNCKTLIAIFPELIISEFLSWGYASFHGIDHLKSKYRSWAWIVANHNQISAARQKTQRIRQVEDKTLLENFTFRLNFTQTSRPWIGRTLEFLINSLLYFLGNLSKALIS